MSLKRTRLKSELPQNANWTLSDQHRRKRLASPKNGQAANEQPDAPDQRRATSQPTPRTTTSKRRLKRRITPLELLQQPLQAGVRKVFDLRRMLFVIGITIVVLLLPTPPGLTLAGHRALALIVFTGSILALEPAPLPIAALLVPIGQIALGINEARDAFAPFGNPVLFLILGSLFLAEALRKHGLTRRLALTAIVRSGGNFRLLVLGLMLTTGLLSMWVLNTATTAVLIPVALTIAQRVQRPDDAKRVLSLLILCIAYSASIGAMATVMGSGENAIASNSLDQVSANGFGFLDWMKYGLPLIILLIPVSWFLLLRLFRLPNIAIDTTSVQQEIDRAGKLSIAEREILLVLSVSVIFWISGTSIEEWLGLPNTILSNAVVAIAAVAVLSVEEIVDWNDLKGVNWGVFFVIGAGLTLGNALEITGATAWFAALLAPMLQTLPYIAILAILVVMSFTLTQFMNNVTLGAILTPVLVTLGNASGIPPERLLLPTIFTLALAYMLPSASARMTLVAVTGAVESKEMIQAGLLVGIPSALIILIYFYALSHFGLI